MSISCCLTAGYLNAELELYEIKKWDSSTLEFVTDAACVIYEYVINRSTEKHTGRRLKKATTDAYCQAVESDLQLSFVNGLSVANIFKTSTPQRHFLAAATAWLLFILVWIGRVVLRKRATYSPKRPKSHARPPGDVYIKLNTSERIPTISAVVSGVSNWRGRFSGS
jgi:hypothetical protein